MSDSFTLPPLLTADNQLTDAGKALVKFADSKVREQRRNDVFDTFAGERYRNWYAATMKSPALQTPEQFIAAYYKDSTADSAAAIWLDYLGTLTPEARARAQIIPDQSTPAKEHKIMNWQNKRQLAKYLHERVRSERGLPETPATSTYVTLVEQYDMPPEQFFESFGMLTNVLFAMMEADQPTEVQEDSEAVKIAKKAAVDASLAKSKEPKVAELDSLITRIKEHTAKTDQLLQETYGMDINA